MKWGLLVAAFILVFFGALLFFSKRGVADLPTKATSPEKLKARHLPTDLPAVFESANPGASANEAYDTLIDFYKINKAQLSRETPPQALVEELVEMVIEAKNAGMVTRPFLDAQMPLKLGQDYEFGDALEVIPSVALQAAMKAYTSGDVNHAIEIARSTWAMGYRCFTYATRLYPRRVGLWIMKDAATLLLQWKDSISDSENILAWGTAAMELDNFFQSKGEIVEVLRPHIGDLINIALNDEDPTFRVRAVQAMGLMRFNPGSAGNKRAIDEALEKLTGDDHPLVAAAAHAAQQVTVEDVRSAR